MSFSFSSLIRLLVLLALGSTMLAVGLSRLDPPRSGWRTRVFVKHFSVNEYFMHVDSADRTPRWLDADTGGVIEGPLSDGDVLEAASSSPWVDEQGRRQVIGRWSSRTKGGPKSMSRDFGLARYTFPGGELLDQVSTEIVPVSPPCWFPGTRARVLFTAGDGMIYGYAFEPEGRRKADAGPAPGRDARPLPLAWRCPKPGGGNIFLSDLTWPEDPRMAGCLVTSLRHQGGGEGLSRLFSRTQLWWLKLNHAGTEIVEAGRLVTPDVSGAAPDRFDERTPVVTTMPEGQTALGYLRQRVGESGWQLLLAPIAIDPGSRVPSVLESTAKVLAANCVGAQPAFSPDGRWVNAIVGDPPSDSRFLRIGTGAASPAPASDGPRS